MLRVKDDMLKEYLITRWLSRLNKVATKILIKLNNIIKNNCLIRNTKQKELPIHECRNRIFINLFIDSKITIIILWISNTLIGWVLVDFYYYGNH